MNLLHRLREHPTLRSFAVFLSVMGPGIITANVDNDAGGITTYSLAGANFGYGLLWSLVPIMFVLILVQEMCNRMGVVTGKGLSDLIREKFGVKTTFYLMLLVLVTNFGNIIAEFAGVAAAGQLFGVSRFVSIPLSAVAVWYMVVKGTYRSVEKIFLVACVFYVSYLITGFLIHPSWTAVAQAAAKPHLSLSGGYLLMLIAVVGTTIAPWMQFYQQSSVAEKGISVDDYAYSRLDVIVGSIGVTVVAFFIVVVCGTVLYRGPGIEPVRTAADAARSLAPLAGEYSSALFAFGLLNASLFAASILPLSTAYSVCESFGWETGVSKTFAEAPQFYILYSLLILVGAFIVLFPNMPLIGIMWLSQVVNGVVLPVVLAAMLIIINDPLIMGRHRNSRLYNALATACVVVLSALSLVLVVSAFR